MASNFREICPNCIDLIEYTEQREIIREEALYQVEKIVRHYRVCKQELSNTITLKFKHELA